MKHTPGPWHTNPSKSFYIFAHGSLSEQAGVEDGPFICSASTQANAHLIASAPDLLAALQALNDAVCRAGYGSTAMPELGQAWEAIAKATGEAV